MISSKSDEQSANFDTFSCLNCKTVISLTPPPKGPKPHNERGLGTQFKADAPRLLCERVDIGRDVLRLPARQRHVHARVRIEQRKCKRFRTSREFPRDHVKRRSVRNISALVGRDDMARDAPRFREALPISASAATAIR